MIFYISLKKLHRYFQQILIMAFVVFGFGSHVVLGQTVLLSNENEEVGSFMRSIYEFSFHKADSIMNFFNLTCEDKVLLYSMKSYLAWWKLLSGDDKKKNIRTFNFCNDESIRLLKSGNQNDINTQLNLIIAYSLKARVDNYSGNKISSVTQFYNSIKYIRKINKSKVKDEKINLMMGLYLYLICYLKSEYFFINPFLLSISDGNKKMGLEYLEKCSLSKNEIVRTEANYFLYKIYFSLEHDIIKADKKINTLIELYPKNIVFNVEKLNILNAQKKANEAKKLKIQITENINNNINLKTTQKQHFLRLIKSNTFN